MASSSPIMSVANVPGETTSLFTMRDATGETWEAVLIKTTDGVSSWVNRCMHFTHIGLDKGSGAEVRDDEIVCTNHGAMFDADTGRCTFGPCEGARLDTVDVAVENGDVYLTDERYEFIDTGPKQDENGDLTSTSNVKF
jgi:nitrite reductase/ring-hydroxylating ferredoxin subunit